MIQAVKQLDGGMDADLVSREHGISRSTLYSWRSRYSGMEVSQLQRLRELERENIRLKKMYSEQALDLELMREVIGKKN